MGTVRLDLPVRRWGVQLATYLYLVSWLRMNGAFRLASYVCHRTDRPTAGGGTAILVRRGMQHHSVPVPSLTHLEATAIKTELAGRPVKNPCGVPFALPPTDRSGPGRLLWWRVAGLNGR